MTLVEVLIALALLATTAASMPLICGAVMQAKSLSKEQNTQARAIGSLYHELETLNWQAPNAQANAQAVVGRYPAFELSHIAQDGAVTKVTLRYHQNNGKTKTYEQYFTTLPQP